ncbi:MAG: PIN domain-containing protein [Rhodoplanes sp.]
MFVLDTNVLSEIMDPHGGQEVLAWCDPIPRSDLFTTALCQAEVLYGIAIMAKGRKRDGLIAVADTMFAEDFRGRILPFDERAAGHFADIFATLKRRGKPIRIVDAQIAAIVRARGMIIVTRNTKDFKNCEIGILNPWSRE